MARGNLPNTWGVAVLPPGAWQAWCISFIYLERGTELWFEHGALDWLHLANINVVLRIVVAGRPRRFGDHGSVGPLWGSGPGGPPCCHVVAGAAASVRRPWGCLSWSLWACIRYARSWRPERRGLPNRACICHSRSCAWLWLPYGMGGWSVRSLLCGILGFPEQETPGVRL
jgi:hypothetical protein